MYRGDDLDLRTPSMRASRESYGEPNLNGSASRRAGARGDGLVVDDTVLACCNHAYDVALAHGASEVRLEHLVHALTRVEAAAEVLESRGIREAHLRRESAAVIASEIPVGLGHSNSSPRTSVEFEDVLRRATDMGRNRGVAATVHDLLWVLLNYNRDIQAIALLLRHAADWQQWDWPHQERREVRNSYYDNEPRTRVVERVVERIVPQQQPVERVVERVVSAPPQQMERVVERVVAPQSSQRRDVAQQHLSYETDLEPVQVRLDQMDASLRRMQSDIANDRRALTELMREVQRDLANGRAGGGGLPAGFAERIDERMSALERSLTTGLKSVDKLVATGISAASDTGLSDLVTQQFIEMADQLRVTTDRMQALERTLDSRQNEMKTALTGDLRGIIERALSTQSQGGGVLQSLLNDRFHSINQQFDQQSLTLTSAVAQLTEPMLERMRQAEGTGQQQMQALRAVAERSTQMEQLVRSYADQNVRTVQQVTEQLAATHQNDLKELHDALLKLGQNQQTLSENLEQWRAENEGGMSIVSNRLEVLERVAAQPVQMLKQLETDVQSLQRVAVADFDQNNQGFFVWLFGTKDPFAGAWRDETAQIRQRLRQLREDRKA